MRRSIFIYGGLLALLLVLAFLRSTDHLGAKDVNAKNVLALDAKAGDIEKVVYHDEKTDVTIEIRKDDVGSYEWITLTEQKKIKKEAPDGSDAPPDELTETETSTFKGGKDADDLVAGFAPLKAIRELEVSSPEKIEELGFKEVKSWFEITSRGRTRRFELGGEAYGTRDNFVRDVEKGKYYLVKADSLKSLKYAKTRLPDRRMTPWEAKDLAQVKLEGPTGSVTMLQKNREDRDAAFWANPADPEKRVSLYANWLEKALKIKGLSYASATETPAELTPAFKMVLQSADAKQDTIEFLVAKGTDGENDWFVRSGFSRGLMKLQRSMAAEVGADVVDVIGAKADEENPDVPVEESAPAPEAKPMPTPPPAGAPIPTRPPMPPRPTMPPMRPVQQGK